MCLTSGADGSTAEGIFTAIDEVFIKNQIPWENYVSLSDDNTNTMIGKTIPLLQDSWREITMFSLQVALATFHT